MSLNARLLQVISTEVAWNDDDDGDGGVRLFRL